MQKFYKWCPSLKHDHGIFYKPENAGYTKDLNIAGQYTEDEITDCQGIIETRKDYLKAKKDTEYHHIYAVPVDKVDQIGRIRKTIRLE